MQWIKELEEYFDNIAATLQPEVREFLEEYYVKKDTHSATSLEGLSDAQLENLLYINLKNEETEISTYKLSLCKNLRILEITDFTGKLNFVEKLSELSILDISSSDIKQKENYFSKSPKLFVFHISSNKEILDFSNEVNRMSKLLICSIGGGGDKYPCIKSFPSNLSNLIYLSINSQKIQKIPNLNQFPNLAYLDLYDNQIKEIPPSIGKLEKLRSLIIEFNKITFLPKQLFKLSNLEYLGFSSNKINTLSNAIFSLPKLKSISFIDNPYENSLNAKMLLEVLEGVSLEDEMPLFQLLKTLSKPTSQSDYNYVTLKIPQSLQTPMLQYIEFFRDYVLATKGKKIIFEVKRDTEGLILVTNGNANITLPELGNYFREYVALTQQKSEDWIFNFDTPTTATKADILRLKMENEIGRLQNAFQIAKLENKNLSNRLFDKQAENEFLKELSQSLSYKIDLLISGKTAELLNVDQLLLDIQDQAVKMLERKHSQQIENLHNDVLTDFLRQKGYIVADQTRSGRSKLGVGEIDIMIRKKDGTPFSIIEAFRLKSCGKDNKIVAEHLDKLLHDYDTAGHARNFVIVYAEAVNFERLWKNYQNYVSELNGKTAFRAVYPLIKFEAKKEISDKSSIKIGLGTHRREGGNSGSLPYFY